MSFDGSQNVRWAIFCLKALVLFLLLWSLGYWQGLKIPMATVDLQNLKKEPYQAATTKKPFEVTANGHSYQIEPLYDYEIWGLVVSDHDSSGWTDTEHESWNDYINTKDICVIWGDNIGNPHLSALNFSHGNWTCYVSTKNGNAWQSFNMNQLSNNHLIPANAQIEKLIAKSNVGDEIRIKGQLVNYSVNKGKPRTTSTVRTDKENGACEIIYVDEFSTMARHNGFWINLAKVGKILSILSAFGILVSIFVVPFINNKNNLS